MFISTTMLKDMPSQMPYNSASFASFVVAQDGFTCARVEVNQYSANL